MSDHLDTILAAKAAHVATMKQVLPQAEVERRARDAPLPRGFIAALRFRLAGGGYALIAEIKKASPSRGLIRPEFDPAALARAYEAGGATCLSVLTDTPFFQGEDRYLAIVREASVLPLLRKDFIIDPYQVAESRMLGADCILLIVAALEDGRARDIMDAARRHELDVLVEVHDETEMDRALTLKPDMIGINNRNLKTLKVDIATAIGLALKLPPQVLGVGESGLSTPEDLAQLSVAGIDTFLIGESLLRHDDVSQAVRTLLIDRPHELK